MATGIKLGNLKSAIEIMDKFGRPSNFYFKTFSPGFISIVYRNSFVICPGQLPDDGTHVFDKKTIKQIVKSYGPETLLILDDKTGMRIEENGAKLRLNWRGGERPWNVPAIEKLPNFQIRARGPFTEGCGCVDKSGVGVILDDKTVRYTKARLGESASIVKTEKGFWILSDISSKIGGVAMLFVDITTEIRTGLEPCYTTCDGFNACVREAFKESKTVQFETSPAIFPASTHKTRNEIQSTETEKVHVAAGAAAEWEQEESGGKDYKAIVSGAGACVSRTIDIDNQNQKPEATKAPYWYNNLLKGIDKMGESEAVHKEYWSVAAAFRRCFSSETALDELRTFDTAGLAEKYYAEFWALKHPEPTHKQEPEPTPIPEQTIKKPVIKIVKDGTPTAGIVWEDEPDAPIIDPDPVSVTGKKKHEPPEKGWYPLGCIKRSEFISAAGESKLITVSNSYQKVTVNGAELYSPDASRNSKSYTFDSFEIPGDTDWIQVQVCDIRGYWVKIGGVIVPAAVSRAGEALVKIPPRAISAYSFEPYKRTALPPGVYASLTYFTEHGIKLRPGATYDLIYMTWLNEDADGNTTQGKKWCKVYDLCTQAENLPDEIIKKIESLT